MYLIGVSNMSNKDKNKDMGQQHGTTTWDNNIGQQHGTTSSDNNMGKHHETTT